MHFLNHPFKVWHVKSLATERPVKKNGLRETLASQRLLDDLVHEKKNHLFVLYFKMKSKVRRWAQELIYSSLVTRTQSVPVSGGVLLPGADPVKPGLYGSA